MVIARTIITLVFARLTSSVIAAILFVSLVAITVPKPGFMFGLKAPILVPGTILGSRVMFLMSVLH
jgi:hypothetical protein